METLMVQIEESYDDTKKSVGKKSEKKKKT